MVIFLVVSILMSAIATGLIVLGGVGKPEQTTTLDTAAKLQTQIATKTLTPTTIPTSTPIPKSPEASPSPTPIKVVISPYITATASADKKSIFITFSSVSDSKSAIYKVTYTAEGGEKGASGNIAFPPPGKTLTREIKLGVCSGSSCTYDTNIKDIKIEVTFTQNDGTTSKITSPHTL